MQRRADFIWTPDQAIRSDLTFRDFIGQGPVHRDDGQNRWFYFRKTFELQDSPDFATVEITADGRYQLFVGGRRVGRGPSRCSPYYQRVDSYDIGEHLSAGENVAAVLVHSYGLDMAWYETVKDYWQALFGDGGLYCEINITAGDDQIFINSDSSWRCLQAAAWNRDTPRSGWGQDFIEDFDARMVPAGWRQAGFDDSDWAFSQVLVDQRDAADRAKGFGPIKAFPTLVPRDIPHLREYAIPPSGIVATYSVEPQPELPIDSRPYEELVYDCPDGCIDDADALLVNDATVTTIRTLPDRDVAVVVEFDELHAGYPFLEIDAVGDEVIEVAVAETIPGEFDTNAGAQPRLARRSFLDGAHVFRYTARAGLQRFEKFEWTGFRFLQLVVRDAPRGLKVRHVGSIATHFPVENEGAYECSDEFLNRLWKIGRHTVLQCSHDAWEDCPGREKRQWVGDGVVRYQIAAAAFGTSIQPLDRNFLLQCLESQRTDGLIQMYAPGDHKTFGVVIPDFSLHFVLTARDYLMQTGDVNTIEAVLPGVQRVLAWFERQSGSNGLLVDVPYWHFIEWADVGRTGAAATINALYCGALAAASRIAAALQFDRLAKKYRQRSKRVTQAINDLFWDAKRNVFVDGVDPTSGKQSEQVSQQANALLMLFDIAPKENCDAIVDYITDSQRVKLTAVPPVVAVGDSFDPQNDVVRCNTFFTHFLYSSLARLGRFDTVLEMIRDDYEPMLATGTTTLWESFEPSASLCHAFSASPVYQLSAYSLGVRPQTPGFETYVVAPQFGDLRFAAGKYPTPAGAIGVKWRLQSDLVYVEVEAPKGVDGEFVVPPGYRLQQGTTRFAAGNNELTLDKDCGHD